MKNPRTSSHENGEKGSLERKMLGFRVLGNQDLEPWLKLQKYRLGMISNPKGATAKMPVPIPKQNSAQSVIETDIPRTSVGELANGVRNSIIRVINVIINQKKRKM